MGRITGTTGTKRAIEAKTGPVDDISLKKRANSRIPIRKNTNHHLQNLPPKATRGGRS